MGDKLKSQKIGSKKTGLAVITVLLFMTILILPSLTFAGGLVPCGGGGGENPCNLCDLVKLADSIIKFLIYDVALPLAGIGILISGILFLTAGGNEEQIKKGKKAFRYVVVGLLLVLAAFLIIDTIMVNLVSSQFLAPWHEFPGC
jgi:hypothetical protein